MPPGTTLVVDDDVNVRRGVALLLERPGHTVVTCHDPDAAIEAIAFYRPDSAFIDIKYSGPFGFEGLDLIGRVRTAVPEAAIVAMSGDASPELESEARRRGATRFIAKPFGAEALQFLSDDPAVDPAAGARVVHLPGIDEIISGSLLVSHFQPIVRLSNGSPIAWEALARTTTDGPLRSPAAFLGYARRRGRSFEMNCACALAAIRSGAPLTRRGSLFINVDPEILSRGDEFVKAVSDAARTASVEMSSLVFEITEGAEIDRAGGLQTIQSLRSAGASIAIDDLGTAYTHLAHIGTIRPSFMKVAQELGTGVGNDPDRARLVRHFVDLARGFDCRLILEGIESEDDAVAGRSLDVELAQGYHFGRPAPADHWLTHTEAPSSPG